MELDGEKLEGKKIFFTDETKMDTAPNMEFYTLEFNPVIKNLNNLSSI